MSGQGPLGRIGRELLVDQAAQAVARLTPAGARVGWASGALDREACQLLIDGARAAEGSVVPASHPGPRVGVVVDLGREPADEVFAPLADGADPVDAVLIVALGPGAAAEAPFSPGEAPDTQRRWSRAALGAFVEASGLAGWVAPNLLATALGDVVGSPTTPLGAAVARAGLSAEGRSRLVTGLWWRPGARPTAAAPFLSVLMRTRGRRPEALRDALCSLYGQTLDDFEVVLLPHNLDVAGLAGLRALVEEFGASFAARVRIVPVQGGGRSRPLNVGAQAARGQYLAILDDDDLALAHWAETYHELARQLPGALLRCRVADQPVADARWPGGGAGASGYTQVGPMETPWEARFDVVQHLWDNRSPNCGWALPIGAYRELKITFDEELPVLEDWDVLTRAMLVCGVSQSSQITSVYRRWQDGGHSIGEHDESQWVASRAAVAAKWADATVVPAGTVPAVRDLALDRRRAQPFLSATESAALAPVMRAAQRAVVASRPARGAARRGYVGLRRRVGWLLRRWGLR